MSITHIGARLREQHPTQVLFLQAVSELLESIEPYAATHGFTTEEYARLERLLMPERIISFRVVWMDDAGQLQANTGYRVQFSSVLGPYKGGLRFDTSVNEDVLKFLGFEQIFKNALTGLPLGGGKGGSDFDPKGKSEREIRSFCRAFMTELHRHIGPETDVPAGDMGVGSREIGYLYGALKEITNRTDGTLTGKGVSYGGSLGRTEATGYGAVYFAKHMLAECNEALVGKSAVVSGAGNVALHAALKLIEEGVTVRTISDRGGYIYKETGFTSDDLELIAERKKQNVSLAEILITAGEYRTGAPWQQERADLYFPCATQNEITEIDARAMVQAGALLVAEGANMPSTLEAVRVFKEAGILFGPAKAVNAGGVAVSGLEMVQNATHYPWTREEVDTKLRAIMAAIHATCVRYGRREDGQVDYVMGANIGGFVRVFSAMRDLGW